MAVYIRKTANQYELVYSYFLYLHVSVIQLVRCNTANFIKLFSTNHAEWVFIAQEEFAIEWFGRVNQAQHTE